LDFDKRITRSRNCRCAKVQRAGLNDKAGTGKETDEADQALVEETLSDLVEKQRKAHPLPHVMAAYLGSHEKFGSLYKKLAE